MLSKVLYISLMKKKIGPSELATKGDLTALEIRIDLKFDDFERKVEDLIKGSTDKILTRIDPVLAEVENTKIDRDLSTEQMEEIRKKIKGHEKRITKLENN